MIPAFDVTPPLFALLCSPLERVSSLYMRTALYIHPGKNGHSGVGQVLHTPKIHLKKYGHVINLG